MEQLAFHCAGVSVQARTEGHCIRAVQDDPYAPTPRTVIKPYRIAIPACSRPRFGVAPLSQVIGLEEILD